MNLGNQRHCAILKPSFSLKSHGLIHVTQKTFFLDFQIESITAKANLASLLYAVWIFVQLSNYNRKQR